MNAMHFLLSLIKSMALRSCVYINSYNDYPLLHKFLELVRNFYMLFNSQQIVGIEEKLIEYICSHTS